MFDFLRKRDVWSAWDEGVRAELPSPDGFELKTMQDAGVYRHVRGAKGLRIAEIGAGHSRVLDALAAQNDCVTVDRLEGHGGGPVDESNPDGVGNIPAFLGEFDPRLEAESFDLVFSISVVEHVASERELEAFHRDQLRILKPGGRFIHAIDLYLEDEPTTYQVGRFDTYRRWVTETPNVRALGPVYDGPCRFSCDLATNPDNVLYAWGRVAPQLTPVRAVSQSVSLIVGGRREGGRTE